MTEYVPIYGKSLDESASELIVLKMDEISADQQHLAANGICDNSFSQTNLEINKVEKFMQFVGKTWLDLIEM